MHIWVNVRLSSHRKKQIFSEICICLKYLRDAELLVLTSVFWKYLFQREEDFMNICIEPDTISRGDYVKRG